MNTIQTVSQITTYATDWEIHKQGHEMDLNMNTRKYINCTAHCQHELEQSVFLASNHRKYKLHSLASHDVSRCFFLISETSLWSFTVKLSFNIYFIVPFTYVENLLIIKGLVAICKRDKISEGKYYFY